MQKNHIKRCGSFGIGNDLISQAVTHQVSSALKSLTAVFGMGTGGPSSLLSPIMSSDLNH